MSCWVIFKCFGVAFHIKQAGTSGKISTHTKKLAQHRQQQHKIWRLHDTHTCTSLLQRANSAFYYAGCMVKKKELFGTLGSNHLPMLTAHILDLFRVR